MTKEQLAEMLNGRQYGDETTPEIERLAKENGLCIAFGASDDLLEFRGSVYDEAGAYNGTVVYLSKKGNVKDESKPGRVEAVRTVRSVHAVGRADDAKVPARAKCGHPRPERVDDDIAGLAQL